MIKELCNKVTPSLWERDILLYSIIESKTYNLSLDVVDLLSMAPSSDTHTCSCMKKINHS